ncbi:uncharacterized protein LOC115213772 isoform X2 [Octopus sinensis]|nr:uncharacterized protein LOC115213772 isoform X2 [Octopus sinensis]
MATMFQPVQASRRNDLHLTSTGIATRYHPGIYFPDTNFQASITNPLPPGLMLPDMIIRSNTHPTTTGIVHNEKFISQDYLHPAYLRAPSLNNTKFIKDLSEKLGAGGWRRPLTMKYEMSETQEEFSNPDGIRYSYAFDDIFKKRPFLLHDHLTYGPSRIGHPAGLEQKSLYEFIPQDKGVFNLLSPNATTYQMTHHAFKPDTLKRNKNTTDMFYPHNSLCPKTPADDNSLKLVYKKPPMQDVALFKNRTSIPRLPKYITTVPHKGHLSEYQGLYERPSHLNQKYIYYTTVETPYTLPKASLSSLMAVPKFYNTEYQTVGSEVPIPV